MNNQNTFTGAKAVPFNTQTQSFGSTTNTPPVNYSMGQVNVQGSQVLGSSPTVVSNASIPDKIRENDQKFSTLSTGYQMKPENDPSKTYNPQQANSQDPSSSTYSGGMNQEVYDPQTGEYLGSQRAGEDYNPSNVGSAPVDDGTGNQKQGYYTPEAGYAMQGYDALKKNADTITAQYLDQAKEKYRIMTEEQKAINTRRENSARNSLIMSGAARADQLGSNSYIDSIVQEGQKAITKLANEEQGIYLEALKAKQDKDERLFDKKVAQLSKIQDAKIDEIKKHNEAIDKHAEEVRKENEDIAKEDTINELYSQGITDTKDIIAQAKKKGVNISAKQASDTVALLSGIGGTGIIGEYNYYKSQAKAMGIEPVDFSTYQNQDANRKAIATGLGGTGVTGITYTPAQAKFITSTNDKVSKNSTYEKTSKMRGFIQNVITGLDAQNGVADIQAINQFQKVIDEGAVTRDQDVKLIQGAQSFANRLSLLKTKLEQGDQLSPQQRQEMKALVTQMYATQIEALNKDPYINAVKKDITRNGIAEEDTILSELGGFGSSTADALLEGNQDAVQAFTELKTKNPPEVLQEISNRLQDLREVLGREPTAQEYFQANPWDRPVKNTAPGIVSNVDITSYATDPKHEQKIASIVSNAPKSNNVFDYDMYIKSRAPKSPVTGQMILNASSTAGVDPKLVLAIIQNDSSFGTKGKAVSTFNPGNVGNDDEGNIKKYPSWEAGVLAVANWLAKHKTTA